MLRYRYIVFTTQGLTGITKWCTFHDMYERRPRAHCQMDSQGNRRYHCPACGRHFATQPAPSFGWPTEVLCLRPQYRKHDEDFYRIPRPIGKQGARKHGKGRKAGIPYAAIFATDSDPVELQRMFTAEGSIRSVIYQDPKTGFVAHIPRPVYFGGVLGTMVPKAVTELRVQCEICTTICEVILPR